MQPLIYDGLAISISFPHYLPWYSGSRHLLALSRSRNSRTKYQICVKLTVIEQRQLVVLVCFSLTFSRFLPYADVFTVDFEHVIASLVCMVCKNQNLLTSQFTVYSGIPFKRNLYYIENNQVIWNPMQINWMILINIRSLTRKGWEFLRFNRLRGPLDSSS